MAMIPGEVKPLLGALFLPPTGPLLLALLGVLWALRRRALGTTLALAGILGLAAISCNGVAVLLARSLLPQVAPAQPRDLERVQAIVVLGGGVRPQAPEYGTPQPMLFALGRIRYGAWLARRTGKPLAYAGGVGWSSADATQTPEGQVASRVLQEDYGLPLRWLDDRSRDTRENAQRMAEAMRPDGIRRIALVTDAWHMPRAIGHFQRAGFEVLPAPTLFPTPLERPVIEWLPSAEGLTTSRQVLREWLGLLAGEAA
ncbi:MAG TPA: YdcF family protein [Ramlibacter sp.]|nr:YdcF family protein [Ramlibacter sp.]